MRGGFRTMRCGRERGDASERESEAKQRYNFSRGIQLSLSSVRHEPFSASRSPPHYVTRRRDTLSPHAYPARLCLCPRPSPTLLPTTSPLCATPVEYDASPHHRSHSFRHGVRPRLKRLCLQRRDLEPHRSHQRDRAPLKHQYRTGRDGPDSRPRQVRLGRSERAILPLLRQGMRV